MNWAPKRATKTIIDFTSVWITQIKKIFRRHNADVGDIFVPDTHVKI